MMTRSGHRLIIQWPRNLFVLVEKIMLLYSLSDQH